MPAAPNPTPVPVATRVPSEVPVATGVPSEEYPYPWSVRPWITGTTPDRDSDLDRVALAKDLGVFMRELRAVPAGEGPAAGAHSFYRGTHPSVHGDQVQQALGQLANQVDVQACQAIWNEAIRTAWPTDPVCTGQSPHPSRAPDRCDRLRHLRCGRPRL